MRNNIIKTLSMTTKILVIACALFLFKATSRKMESKVENVNLNKTLDLVAVTETVETLEYTDYYKIQGTYVGMLTGYAADCPLCSGFLGCYPYMDVRDRTTTYEDETFGTVRIVASSSHLPCGSIISFKSERVSDSEVIAIVLDRGVTGKSIDLLTESEEYAYQNVSSFSPC